MYKLIIVDDEQIEREGMAQFIPWDKYDVELVGTAWNGLDGFEQIQEKRPDIVLTDIKMPVMNGIELIRKLNENFPDICVVVLSGYGEYEYTSQAMEHGVRHYILKPCDEEKIVSVLEDAKKEVDKKRDDRKKEEQYHQIKRRMLPRAKEEVFRSLLQNRELPDGEQELLKQELSELGDQVILVAMKNQAAGFDYLEQFILGNILGEVLGKKKMPLSTSIGDTILFLFDASVEKKLEKAVEKTMQEFSRMKTRKIITAVSGYGKFESINTLYEQILYLYALGENSKDTYLCYTGMNEEQDNSNFYFDFGKLQNAKQYDDVLFGILFALKKMDCKGYSLEKKKSISQMFLLAWSQRQTNKTEIPDTGACQTEEELLCRLSEWIAQILGLYRTDKDGIRMQQILIIIYQNFSNQDISIQYLAKEILFMNEDYFGRMFIKMMQMKFSAYLEEKRIQMAQCLLAYDTDMKISDITELVGYPPDGQYFSKAFRKVCGKTPSEYREELKKTEK